jgi:hypothetical protein
MTSEQWQWLAMQTRIFEPWYSCGVVPIRYRPTPTIAAEATAEEVKQWLMAQRFLSESGGDVVIKNRLSGSTLLLLSAGELQSMLALDSPLHVWSKIHGTHHQMSELFDSFDSSLEGTIRSGKQLDAMLQLGFGCGSVTPPPRLASA